MQQEIAKRSSFLLFLLWLRLTDDLYIIKR